MAKKNKKEKNDNFIELCAGLGFSYGTVLWFIIYFPKSDLYYGKLLMYMFVGIVVGGIIGEVIQHYKKNKKNK